MAATSSVSSKYFQTEFDVTDPLKCIQSGMLLNHYLVYNSLDLRVLRMEDEEDDLSFIVSTFERMNEYEKKSFQEKLQILVYDNEIDEFLASTKAEIQQNRVLWLHIVEPSHIPRILSQYNLDPEVQEFFTDSVSKNYFFQSEREEIFYSLSSFSVHAGIVNMKKITAYATPNFVVTLEENFCASDSLVYFSQMEEDPIKRDESFSGKSSISVHGRTFVLSKGMFLQKLFARIRDEDIYKKICSTSKGSQVLLYELSNVLISLMQPCLR